jgi:hypothetical protein
MNEGKKALAVLEATLKTDRRDADTLIAGGAPVPRAQAVGTGAEKAVVSSAFRQKS